MTISLKPNKGNGYRSKRLAGSDPFTDLLFNVLLGFILLFFISIIFLNPDEDAGKVDIEAEYVITVTWEDYSADDIDTWVEDPEGQVAFYKKRETNILHLDRDDRGMLNDRIVIEGREIDNPLNQEVLALRGMMPGEYTVNVHYYDTVSMNAVPVAVKVARVNPVYEVVYYGTTTLEEKGSEQTAVRFTVLPDGNVGNVNRLPKALVDK
ncbi:MAG: hypothetical protein V3U65_07790 [Granulosicoccaceae bacterium]